MGYKVKTVTLDKEKMLAILDGPKYSALAKARGETLKEIAIQIFNAKETEPGVRESELTPPVYIESFVVKKIGRKWRVVNTDPGALLVEFSAHPGGGSTRTLGYAPMRLALDALEAEAR